jgi:protein ImuB
MAHRRILSLWFPRLAAERLLRRRGDVLPEPFAVVAEQNGAQLLTSLNAEAEALGLRPGQALRDATAICAGLRTMAADPVADAAFLTVLRRWAEKFSPWVAEERPDSVLLDITGCAHLFGGEEAMLAEVQADCDHHGLSLRAGLGDTPGAAWALARYGGDGAMAPLRNGDAIQQEARATRSRAVKRRHWERGGAAPSLTMAERGEGRRAAPGEARQALAPLPLAALRLPADVIEGLGRLGLRRVADVMDMPRAALARRFGAGTLRRLDQALGLEPEPVAPARAPLHFAVRLTFPDPIGLLSDLEAGMDRLLPPLCTRLRAKARGARRVRLEAYRVDGRVERAEIGLARPANEPDRIRPLLRLKLEGLEAGFGIDCLRLEAVETEPFAPQQYGQEVALAAPGFEDLLGKLAARMGAEAITRLHPAQSHIPEKSSLVLAALWSAPHPASWPAPPTPRPLLLFPPEPVSAAEGAQLPTQFRWRGRDWQVRRAFGPERIAPEWWLDDPDWRSGPRDYWQVEEAEGLRLWLYYAHGGALSAGWFCHGSYA